VDEALTVIVTAAELLGFRGLTELENRLWEMNEPLRLLAAAGELAGLSFSMQDQTGIYGVRVLFDSYGVEDYEEVDLSGLRLLASAEACGHLHIVCLDSDFVQGLVGTDWLPDATDALTVALSFNTDNDSIDDPEPREEESDDDDNKVEY
jgi:hypothetical protein